MTTGVGRHRIERVLRNLDAERALSNLLEWELDYEGERSLGSTDEWQEDIIPLADEPELFTYAGREGASPSSS